MSTIDLDIKTEARGDFELEPCQPVLVRNEDGELEVLIRLGDEVLVITRHGTLDWQSLEHGADEDYKLIKKLTSENLHITID